MARNPLALFVAARFWIAPAVIAAYYGQLLLPRAGRIGCLLLLVATLVVAIPANYMWIVDYRDRIVGGITFLRDHGGAGADEKEALAQIRWSNAKILGIVGVVLAVLLHYQELEQLPFVHRVPVLIVTLLVFIALFDAALDLEAEWTVSALAAKKSATTAAPAGALLSHVIWNTNQFRKAQQDLYSTVQKGEVNHVPFGSFTATAQNLISFAAIIVFCVTGITIRLLILQLLSLACASSPRS